MASKSATSTVAHKVPVALFIAAIVILAQGLIARNRQDDGRVALPDPRRMALLSMGRIGTPNVVKLWEQRVQAVPDSATFRTKLADSTLALAGEIGDLSLYARAEGIARSAVEIDPTNESANLTLASALSGQHNFGGALELANGVLDRTPKSVSARIAAADAHLELGDYDIATTTYVELGNELPDTPSILSRRARIAALTGGLDQAIDLARQALIGAGEDDLDTFTAAFYWFQLANYQYQDGRYDDAAAMLKSALQVEPDHVGSIELLGKVLVAQGRFDEATRLYEALLQRTDAADLRGELAKLYARAGRVDESERQVELGLAIAQRQAGQYPAERRHLISFLADHDPALALRLARADLELRSDVQTYGWLTWSLLQAGEADEAATYVDKALKLGTQDVWLLYQSGSVYAAVGEVDRARTQLSAALDLNPEFDLVHAQRARDLLASLPAGA
jgi:tetratricopeptide (TPR) repeat protein